MSEPLSPKIRALLADCMSALELEYGSPHAELREVLGVPPDAPIGTPPPEPGEQTLLPCPFCGTLPNPARSVLLQYEGGGEYRVICGGCGAAAACFTSTEDAIAAWNRRHPGGALRSGEVTFNEARAERGLPPLSDGGEQEITLTETRGFLWWRREIPHTYRGSGTVWREMPSGRRADTATEALLADMAWLRSRGLC